ncbi:macrolide family glycosyltransferase [Streptomyces sp. NPDC048483]|uniref:macrolide family glycosyltransferase n=1 Tax=Streptomyces sp. NPDC048483 TaxID=3154927 RepID=UPI003415B26F
MPPAHIAVFSYAAGGHVTPILGLVEELVGRGHRVTWVTTEEFSARVAAGGATAVLHPASKPVFAREAVDITPENAAELSVAQFRQTTDAGDVAEAHFADDAPDLVLYDATVLAVGRMISLKLGCPAVQVFPTFAANDKFNLFEKMPETSRMLAETGVSRMLADMLGEFLALHGLDVSVEEFYSKAEPLSLAVLPKAFQYAHERFDDDRVVFVGPCLGARADDRHWEPPADSDLPVVLVSLGSHRYNKGEQLLRNCVAALADVPCHVVLATGRHLRPEDLGPLPPHFEARSWVPQTAVLRRADALVSSGGMGGTTEAMYFGVPLVSVPVMPEQTAVADRVAETGIGVEVPYEEATPERLRDAVTHVLSDAGIRHRMNEFQRYTREAGGSSRAVDAIEGYLKSVREDPMTTTHRADADG